MRPMSLTWICACAVAGLLGSQNAVAQIVKCKVSSGGTVYTQGTCPDGTQSMDLPEGVSTGDVGSSSGGSAPRVLSRRAVELQKSSAHCRNPSNAECNEYRRVEELCRDPSKSSLPDCEALVQVRQPDTGSRGSQTRESKTGLPASCESGDRRACKLEMCGGIFTDATVAQVRNCSRALGHPSGDNWAQIDERKEADRERYDFLCLTAVTVQRGTENQMTVRTGGQVTRYTGPQPELAAKGYQVDDLRGQSFRSVAEAASATCTMKVANLRK